LLDTLSQSDLARVLVTFWANWWARRKAIHDGEFQSPISTFMFINKYLEDLEVANVRSGHSGCLKPERESRRVGLFRRLDSIKSMLMVVSLGMGRKEQ
jgi:hypothetical protein